MPNDMPVTPHAWLVGANCIPANAQGNMKTDYRAEYPLHKQSGKLRRE